MKILNEASKLSHGVTYDDIILQVIRIEKQLDNALAILGADIEK